MAFVAPASPSTKETTNYARLCRVLVDVGTCALRDCFDVICTNSSHGLGSQSARLAKFENTEDYQCNTMGKTLSSHSFFSLIKEFWHHSVDNFVTQYMRSCSPSDWMGRAPCFHRHQPWGGHSKNQTPQKYSLRSRRKRFCWCCNI